MAEVKLGLRYNATTEEVELTVDGEVAFSSGKDVFESWVKAYNEAHKPVVVEPEPVPAPAPVADATVAEPVEQKVVDPAEPVQETEPKEVESTVDTEAGE